MTSLRKLGLRGVRSYSQQSEESIEFLKPLTIIVGANGAGKTSIIESLKFATTGALPPLSDGGKCWAADTLLMQYDGTTKRVQNIAVSATCGPVSVHELPLCSCSLLSPCALCFLLARSTTC